MNSITKTMATPLPTNAQPAPICDGHAADFTENKSSAKPEPGPTSLDLEEPQFANAILLRLCCSLSSFTKKGSYTYSERNCSQPRLVPQTCKSQSIGSPQPQIANEDPNEDLKRTTPNDSSQTKDLKPELWSKRSQTKIPKRKFPNEHSQRNIQTMSSMKIHI